MGQHVLVPVDRSSQAEKAFEYALEELSDPEITLIHVINPMSAIGYGDEEYFDIEEYHREEKRRRKAAEELFAEYRERAAERGIDVETVITQGKPAKRILAIAEERNVDHIVMGSHGRSGIGRIVFGSVAETVTRRSPVPVTIIR